jgi:hypothetical protein
MTSNPDAVSLAFQRLYAMKNEDSARALSNEEQNSRKANAKIDSQRSDKQNSDPRKYHRRMYSQIMVPHVLQQDSDEIDAMMSDFVNDDLQSGKTWSRRFVEAYLLPFSWYAPRRMGDNPPSLRKVVFTTIYIYCPTSFSYFFLYLSFASMYPNVVSFCCVHKL